MLLITVVRLNFIFSWVLQTIETDGKWISVDQICMGNNQPILDLMPVRYNSDPWKIVLLEMESVLRFNFLVFLFLQGSAHTRWSLPECTQGKAMPAGWWKGPWSSWSAVTLWLDYWGKTSFSRSSPCSIPMVSSMASMSGTQLSWVLIYVTIVTHCVSQWVWLDRPYSGRNKSSWASVSWYKWQCTLHTQWCCISFLWIEGHRPIGT